MIRRPGRSKRAAVRKAGLKCSFSFRFLCDHLDPTHQAWAFGLSRNNPNRRSAEMGEDVSGGPAVTPARRQTVTATAATATDGCGLHVPRSRLNRVFPSLSLRHYLS